VNTAGQRLLLYREEKKPGSEALFSLKALAVTPVSLVVLLSLSDVTEAARPLLLRTLVSSLDPTLVSLKPRLLGPNQEPRLDALSASAAVVQVTWRSPTEAVIRAALRPHTFTERALTFTKSDPLRERSRAIAFTVAAMMPQWRPQTPQPEDEEIPAIQPLTDADFGPSPVDAGTVEQPVAVDAGFSAPTTRQSPPRLGGIIELAGVGVLPGPSAAGELAAAICISAICTGIRATLGGGLVELAQAQRLDVRVAAFGEVRMAPWANSRLGFTARLSLGGAWLQVSRANTNRDRASPFVHLEAGPLLHIGPLDITLPIGVLAWGPTSIVVGDIVLAQLAPLVATGRLAFGWRW
jgi:hypothetical protein